MTLPKVLVDLPTNTIRVGDRSIIAQAKIAEIVHCLAEVAPRPVTLDRLIARLSGWHEPMAHETLRVHITRARNAIRTIGLDIGNIRGKGWFLQTMDPALRGVGALAGNGQPPSIVVDTSTMTLSRDGASIKVQPREAEIVSLLLESETEFASEDYLIKRMSGVGHPMTMTGLYMAISYARRSLAFLGARILNRQGVGWRLIIGDPPTFVVSLPIAMRPELLAAAGARECTIDDIAAHAMQIGLSRMAE